MVLPLYESTAWHHGWPHISSVASSSAQLAEIVAADPELCLMAAYAHDLGRTIEKKGPELGNTEHAQDSVSKTVELLYELGIKDSRLSTIIDAIVNHSNRSYTGNCLITKVLRDCDKKDALGSWGTLRCTRHWFKKDLIPMDEIIANAGNPAVILELAQETSRRAKHDPQLKDYLANLNFVLEWIDGKMLDNQQSYEFLRTDYKYSFKERQFFIAEVLEQLAEKSKVSPRKRSMHFFHEPSDKGNQFGINMIQPDSYVSPHARFESESIFHLQGELCYLQFDEKGNLNRREIISNENPYIYIPGNSFHTIVSLQKNSAIGVTVRGPLREPYRIEASWAPVEQGPNAERYFQKLEALALSRF